MRARSSSREVLGDDQPRAALRSPGPNFTSRSDTFGIGRRPSCRSPARRSGRIGRVARRADHADVDLAAVDELLGQRLVLQLVADLAHPLGQLLPVLAPPSACRCRSTRPSAAGLTISGKRQHARWSRRSRPSKVAKFGVEHLVVLEQLLGEDLVLRQEQPRGARAGVLHPRHLHQRGDVDLQPVVVGEGLADVEHQVALGAARSSRRISNTRSCTATVVTWWPSSVSASVSASPPDPSARPFGW